MVTVVAGPTASGKSALAIELAKQIDGEIVGADSMQIYRGMDIGTAKVCESAREVPHFGIDILDPGEPYSASLFQNYARAAFDDIEGRGKTPILCGGTGFYIRAAIDDYDFPKGEQRDNPAREKYLRVLSERGACAVWEILKERDPASAEAIHPNNSKRVIRALEMLDDGQNYAELAGRLKNIPQLIPAYMLCISVDREILYSRIDARVDEMRERGLIDEVKGLLQKGFRDALTASQAIGYKEIVRALEGEIGMDEAFDDIKRASRRYAKRQRSWFGADKRYHVINGDSGNIDCMLNEALEIIESVDNEPNKGI